MNKLKIQHILNLLILITFITPNVNTYAAKHPNYVEFSRSIRTSSFDSITSIGIFTQIDSRRGEKIYVGLQFSQFDFTNNIESNISRVVVGVSTVGKISPFIEVGTDLLSALILSNTRNNTNNTYDCQNNTRCDYDGFLKAGIRIDTFKGVRLSLFYEGISFGDFHNRLTGNHRQSGFSIAIDF